MESTPAQMLDDAYLVSRAKLIDSNEALGFVADRNRRRVGQGASH